LLRAGSAGDAAIGFGVAAADGVAGRGVGVLGHARCPQSQPRTQPVQAPPMCASPAHHYLLVLVRAYRL